jgi:hypothetical protein
MLPSKSRVQKAGSTPAKAPKIIQHRSSPTQYWKCPDCSFRLDHYSGLHTTEAQVGNSSYLIEYSDRFFVKSHIRQRHETHPRHSSQPRLGCHLCILKSAEEGEAKGDYNRLVTAWEGRDALLQHIADRHLKRFPSPKVMQVVDGTLDSRTQEADIRFWER